MAISGAIRPAHVEILIPTVIEKRAPTDRSPSPLRHAAEGWPPDDVDSSRSAREPRQESADESARQPVGGATCDRLEHYVLVEGATFGSTQRPSLVKFSVGAPRS